MERVLYHGSDHRVEHPRFGAGKPYNDYGRGFYCTAERELAMELAVDRNRNGFANRYTLDDTDLDILNLNDGSHGILEWLAILLEYREFDAPSPLAFEAKGYLREHFVPSYRARDVIVGYRADDSYFSFAQDFVNGTISIRQLERAMHLGNLGEQVVIKSERAFERLRFLGAEPALASV